ncbi:signal peptide-containing protein [Babesia caballi]|uniref:Signal peptide-containing protein n=1 Tax=Babesia caballi TaxID=5871 RepID=A0AAV4LPG7_BABCB|nr:signal peptide-containing protein [Babesia caballi]
MGSGYTAEREVRVHPADHLDHDLRQGVSALYQLRHLSENSAAERRIAHVLLQNVHSAEQNLVRQHVRSNHHELKEGLHVPDGTGGELLAEQRGLVDELGGPVALALGAQLRHEAVDNCHDVLRVGHAVKQVKGAPADGLVPVLEAGDDDQLVLGGVGHVYADQNAEAGDAGVAQVVVGRSQHARNRNGAHGGQRLARRNRGDGLGALVDNGVADDTRRRGERLRMLHHVLEALEHLRRQPPVAAAHAAEDRHDGDLDPGRRHAVVVNGDQRRDEVAVAPGALGEGVLEERQRAAHNGGVGVADAALDYAGEVLDAGAVEVVEAPHGHDGVLPHQFVLVVQALQDAGQDRRHHLAVHEVAHALQGAGDFHEVRALQVLLEGVDQEQHQLRLRLQELTASPVAYEPWRGCNRDVPAFLHTRLRSCAMLIAWMCANGASNPSISTDDEEAMLTTAAYLSRNTLRLYTGNVRLPLRGQHVQVNYLTLDLNDAISPIETLGDKCFAIRSRDALPNVLCASGLLDRNKWVNAIDASMLCAETGVRSTLPLIPGEETLEELDEEKPSGINLFIHDGPVGRPEIYINGKTTKELEDERNRESLDAAHIEPEMDALGDLDQLFPTFESSEGDPMAVEPVDAEALAEARAEAGMVDDTTPDMGYYKQERAL